LNVGEGFRDAMISSGMPIDEPVRADGTLRRAHAEGDRPGVKNVYYVLHTDGIPAGHYGCHKRDIKQNWCSKSVTHITPAERAEYDRKMVDARAQREAEVLERRRSARTKAALVWAESKPVEEHLEGTLLLASTLSPPHAQIPEKPKSLLKIVRWSFTEARSLAYPITYNPVFLYGGLFLLAVSMVLATISV